MGVAMGSITGNLLAQAEEEREGIDLILPAVDELVWGIICFLIVAVVLSKVAFPALRAGIEKREQTIQGNLEESEKARNEAQKQLDEYRKQLADARGEANRIIEEARQSAEQVRKDLTAKAEAEAEQIVARAQEQIEAERARTVTELQSTIAELSIQLAEKVVGRSLDGGSQKELVDAYIKEVGEMSSSNGGGR
jgi:F-type H+-transporting ATPase subunit b